MARRKPTLEDFLEMRVPNLYIWHKTIECYMRKGRVYVDGQIRTALTISNITNKRRSSNIEFKTKHRRTGLFREFETHVRELAAEHGYDGVYVEIVLNEFLPDVLERYGYKRVNIRDGLGPDYTEQNYWFSVKDNERSG
jgi:hypothetical protein